jgi:hypothetical protein
MPNARFGSDNPNFKNAGHKVCIKCGCNYHNYNSKSLFCSQFCYNSNRVKKTLKIKLLKQPQSKICKFCEKIFLCSHTSAKITCSNECSLNLRKSKKTTTNCLYCGKIFDFSPSQKRKYCSYKCHLDSGGAFRAGIESSKAIMKYGAKKDANHHEIFDELKKYCAVYDLSTHGYGLPDGLAWINDAWHLFDVKNPKTSYGRKGLNNIQKKWLTQWKGGPVYLIYTTDEAKDFAHGNFENLKKEGGYVKNVENSGKSGF